MAISIAIGVGETVGSTTVTAVGTDQGLITADEASGMNLGDPISLVNAYFGGGPQCAFFCDPCNDGQNWYATYGWLPVTVTRQVASARVTGVSVNPTIASTQVCDNQTKQTVDFTPSLSTTVTNSVSSTSSSSSTVTVAQEISYDISFLGSGGGGTTSLSYESSWEESYTKTAEESFSLTSSTTVPVPPGEKVIAELMLSQGTITIEICYELSLNGMVTAGYYHEYQGHHIWAFEVNNLLASQKHPTTVTDTETLTIDFYADASIVVKNSSGKVVQVFSPGNIEAAPETAPANNVEASLVLA